MSALIFFYFPYHFPCGLFWLLGRLVSCVVLFLTPDLGSFLVPLYHLTGASSAFLLGSSVTGPDRLVLFQTSSLTTRPFYEAMHAHLKGRAGERLGAPLEFQGDMNSNISLSPAFLSIPTFFPS